MTKTKTPISERTDEELVRAIAGWMKIDDIREWARVPLDVSYNPAKGLLYGPNLRVHGQSIFVPHLGIGSADRERVMLDMPRCNFEFVAVRGLYTVEIEWYGRDDDTQGHLPPTYTATSTSLDRAFCEAVVAWIEAQ